MARATITGKKNGETGAQDFARASRLSPNVGGDVGVQGEEGGPGAGRAKLRLSRGFPCRLAYGVIPYDWFPRRRHRPPKKERRHRLARFLLGRVGARRMWGVTLEGRAKRSPGSGGASPYLNRGFSYRFTLRLSTAAIAAARWPAMTCQTFSDAFITPAAPAPFSASESALPAS